MSDCIKCGIFAQVYIDGTTLHKGLGGVRQNVFVSNNGATGLEVMSVERVALQYYADKEGFSEGIHGENGTFTTLFGILCWSEIFPGDILMVPNAVYCQLQSEPLDLNYPEFFASRKELFQHRFLWFSRAKIEVILSFTVMLNRFNTHLSFFIGCNRVTEAKLGKTLRY